MSTNKPTVPLLDAESIAGFFVHVIRKSPYVRGVTMTISIYVQHNDRFT